MNSYAHTLATLPDVTLDQNADLLSTLDWVGMKGIALPVMIEDSSGYLFSDNAKAQVCVNIIDPQVKGIHMSRLYLLLEEFANHSSVSPASICTLLCNLLATHAGISNSAQLTISGNALIKRDALKSNNSGWKSYPLIIKATYTQDGFKLELAVKIAYSSSCPCSAALSRQLLQQAFSRDFADVTTINKDTVNEWILDNGSAAIPHSQRSYADVWIRLKDSLHGLPIIDVISACESTLKTPVQTAVKREDEQEFAHLNGQHQQFCEDAARRLKATLEKLDVAQDYWLQVDHQESLHAHDAIATTTKGLPGGYMSHMALAL